MGCIEHIAVDRRHITVDRRHIMSGRYRIAIVKRHTASSSIIDSRDGQNPMSHQTKESAPGYHTSKTKSAQAQP
jgi:hypothetical protein